jgi:Uma2 family endonuclease
VDGGNLRTRRWSRAEYERLIEAGLLDEDEPIELLAGQLVVREPQHAWHATGTRLIIAALRRAFGAGWEIDHHLPIALDDESEPEPDVAVVRGGPRDYRDAHPSRPVLIVEVADSSLASDRRYKGSLYARAGIPDYWILNRGGHCLEVYRDPEPDAFAAFGWRYGRVLTLRSGDIITPLAAPGASIPVADLLP